MSAPQVRAVSRTVTFAPGLALPLWGWSYLGQPLHWAGLAVLAGLGLVIWPFLAVAVLCFLPSAPLSVCTTRKARKRYRHRLINRGIPREKQRSSYISDRLKRITYAADRGRCAYCHRHLAWHERNCDHFLPWSQGGLTVFRNMTTLCARDNVIKSNYWPGVHYRPIEGSDNLALAIAILAAEKRRRRNPLRWVRAAWALAS